MQDRWYATSSSSQQRQQQQRQQKNKISNVWQLIPIFDQSYLAKMARERERKKRRNIKIMMSTELMRIWEVTYLTIASTI